MLVISQKQNDRILIGDNIEIVVMRMQNGYVRLGFNAPDDVEIIRQSAKNKTRRNRNVQRESTGTNGH